MMRTPDAFEKLADRVVAKHEKRRERKIKSLGDLPKLVVKIERCPFYFTPEQIVLMHDATEKYLGFLVETKAPLDMQQITLNMVGDLVVRNTDHIVTFNMDTNEFHIVSAALQHYDVKHELLQGLIDFFLKGEAMK